MRRVFKYGLDMVDEQIIRAPREWHPLSVQLQNGQPMLWALVDDSALEVEHRVFVHGTGHKVNPSAVAFAGTFQLSDMGLVFHVFVGK